MELIRNVIMSGEAKKARSIFINNKKINEQAHILGDNKVKEAVQFLGGHALLPVSIVEEEVVEDVYANYHIKVFSNDVVVTLEIEKEVL